MPNFEKPKYCPFCGSLLPKMNERPSLETTPYETCKSCGETFIALKTGDVHGLFDILNEYLKKVLPTHS